MDPNLSKFPILSYILSEQDPYTYPSLPPQTHHNLFTHFPHLTDPRILASLSQSIPATVTQTHFLLRSLGSRPDPSAVSSARSKITQIQETQSSSGEAEIYKAVIRMEEMHEDYERQLTEVEENLTRIYRSAMEEMGGEDEVNEEVVRILKEAENGVVERVELSGRQLRLLPEAFGKLHGLVYLNLSNNQIEVIPDSIGGLKKLEELDASSNLLQYLPDSIGLLLNLRILNVSGNKLNALPESIARCSSLLELDASFNNLSCLPTNIGELDLSNNQIRALPYTFGRLGKLSKLNLDQNPLIVPPMEIANKGADAVKEFMSKRWHDIITEEQRRMTLETSNQQAQTGWLSWGTSLVSNVVSGVSQRVGGYLSGPKTPRDPYLDQQL
ncbi:plant intracellular Ras-group-related LRR protein 3 isoform X2 [Durio zibethinus]|uniref:Plant intracellular Ras-group-related LRR protein 3 isoform X2 n=1 Tax=Durio zibethinus TaxID=66656 RepID=A0A6P6BGD7_DURZI|nr:plant intracellular Ras-group-related LRR protein 3 isoform X2 [Durio zibethinus]